MLVRWLAIYPDRSRSAAAVHENEFEIREGGSRFTLYITSSNRVRNLWDCTDTTHQLDNLTPYTLRCFFDERFGGRPAVHENVLGRHSTPPMPTEELATHYAETIYSLTGS